MLGCVQSLGYAGWIAAFDLVVGAQESGISQGQRIAARGAETVQARDRFGQRGIVGRIYRGVTHPPQQLALLRGIAAEFARVEQGAHLVDQSMRVAGRKPAPRVRTACVCRKRDCHDQP